MEDLHLAYLLAAGLALPLVLFSSRLRELPVTGPLIALAAGVLVGPAVLRVLVVPEGVRDLLLLEGARALLAVSLIGVALRFPPRTAFAVRRPVLLLLLLVLPLAALVTGTAAVLLLGMPVALAALLGVCLSPTDPVLASDVVSGGPAERDLPERVRAVLTEESGLNDGLALPLVLVALAPVLSEAASGQAGDALRQVVVAAVLGVVVGLVVGRGVEAVRARDEIEGPSELVLTLVLAVAVLGAARVLHADGVLAVFVAGLAYGAVVDSSNRQEELSLDEVANRYLVLPFFLLLGTVLPWDEWARFGWGALGFAAAVLLLRRPPVVVLLAPLLGLRWRDAVFAGWFGPIGVSAVFYVVLSLDEGVTDPRLFAAGTLAVAASTVAHGTTAVPGRRRYARHEQPAATG